MNEETKEYSQTITSFSGTDVIAVVEGEVMGEFQELSYTQDYSLLGNTVRGSILAVVFDRDLAITTAARERGPFINFALYYANEYGQRMKLEFKHFQLKKRIGGTTIDEIMQEERFEFEAIDAIRKPGVKFDYETKKEISI